MVRTQKQHRNKHNIFSLLHSTWKNVEAATPNTLVVYPECFTLLHKYLSWYFKQKQQGAFHPRFLKWWWNSWTSNCSNLLKTCLDIQGLEDGACLKTGQGKTGESFMLVQAAVSMGTLAETPRAGEVKIQIGYSMGVIIAFVKGSHASQNLRLEVRTDPEEGKIVQTALRKKSRCA